MRTHEELLAQDEEALRPFRALAGPRTKARARADLHRRIEEVTAWEEPLRVSSGDAVALAGDWHAKPRTAMEVLGRAAEQGVFLLLQLGDLGFFSDPDGQRFLDAISRRAAELNLTVLWVDGNHEDFDLLERYPVMPAGHPGAGLRPVRPRFWHLPRGTRWSWPVLDEQGQLARHRWLALGGAASVDRDLLVAGRSWWPQEEITEEQAEAVIRAGGAEVMLCHDRPSRAGLVSGQAAGVWSLTAPHTWDRTDTARADAHSERLQRVVDAVRPHHLWHGHLHERRDVSIPLSSAATSGDEQHTWVHGLGDHTGIQNNFVLVGLDGNYLLR